MKVLCLILLLGCAAAGPVAAATVGIAAAPVTLSPAASVNLTITSFPAGAAIWLNGTDSGMATPGTVSLDRNRAYSVTLTLAGYREYSFTPNLTEGIPPPIVAQLEPVTLPGGAAQEATLPPVSRVMPGARDTSLLSAGSGPHATRVPAIRKDEGVVDSFVGFFSGIFTRPDCPASLRACGRQCVDLQADAANCGLCGSVCPAGTVCNGGECLLYGTG